jgi:hypothetical protein
MPFNKNKTPTKNSRNKTQGARYALVFYEIWLSLLLPLSPDHVATSSFLHRGSCLPLAFPALGLPKEPT